MSGICDTASKFIGDTARPASIVVLACGLVTGMLQGVQEGALTVVMLAFSAAVGARTFENHTQIRADAEIKKAEAGR